MNTLGIDSFSMLMLVNLDVIIDIDNITAVIIISLVLVVVELVVVLLVPMVGPKLAMYFLVLALNSLELRTFTTLLVAPQVPRAMLVAANAPSS